MKTSSDIGFGLLLLGIFLGLGTCNQEVSITDFQYCSEKQPQKYQDECFKKLEFYQSLNK